MAKQDIDKVRQKIEVAMKLPGRMQREKVLAKIIRNNYGLLGFDEVKDIIKTQNTDMTDSEIEKQIETIVCSQNIEDMEDE